MRKFIIKTLIFGSILLILDRAFIIFRYAEKNIFHEIAQKKIDTIKPLFNKNFDILILGSSHAQFGISCEILESKSNQSCLNLAYGSGANIGKQLTLLKKVIELKNKPRSILLGIDVFTLNRSPIYTDEFLEVLLKINKNTFFSDYPQLTTSYTKIYARFIPQYIKDVLKGDFTLPYLREEQNQSVDMFKTYNGYEVTKKGWVKGYGVPNLSYIRYSNYIFNPHEEALRDLQEFIDLCTKENISLYFFHTPEHAVSLSYQKKYIDFKHFMQSLAKQHETIKYLDYNNANAFPVKNDSLFFDTDHLNKVGGELFSTQLIEDILLHDLTPTPTFN